MSEKMGHAEKGENPESTQATKVEYGVEGVGREASLENPFPVRIQSKDMLHYWLEVSKGNVPGHSAITVVGASDRIGSTSYEDIWDPGSVAAVVNLDYPAANEQWEIVSTSAEDAPGLSGATHMRERYMNDAYVEQAVTIEMDGLTPVDFPVADGFRHLHSIVALAGSTRKNVGDIIVRRKSDALVRGQVTAPALDAGGGNSRDGHHTVPAGFTDYIIFAGAIINKNQDVDFHLESTLGTNTVWHSTFEMSLYQTPTFFPIILPFAFQEKSDLRIIGKSSDTVADGTAVLWFIRVENS